MFKYFIFLLGSGVVVAQLTQCDREEIVEVHNELRSQIALGTYSALGKTFAPAVNMRKLTWSVDIEAQAQEYSKICQMVHSHIPGYGENLYMFTGRNLFIEGEGYFASVMWSREFQESGMNSTYLDKEILNEIGRATQMAWATASKIGCGARMCDNGKSVFVVCQYDAQNDPNKPVYKEGPTCSECPSGTTCEKESGLCV